MIRFCVSLLVCRPGPSTASSQPSTRMNLVTSPYFPAKLMVIWTWPLLPASNRHGSAGSFATVQPQEGVSFSIYTTDWEMLVALKVNKLVVSPALAVYSLFIASHAKTTGGDVAPGATVGVEF